MRHRTMAATVVVVALAVGGVVAGTSATTRALFSDTASGADSRAGAATVALGRGGGSVELGYTDLKPGRRQVVDLTISYVGSVPADVTLEIAAPSGSSALCVQDQGQWQSRRGGAVTVTIGRARPVSYCELLNGRALLLASAVPPGSERHVDVAVLLSKGADDNMRGLAERDVATVRASVGGFTDNAVGTISITTAGRDKDKDGDRKDGDRAEHDQRTGGDVTRKPSMTSAAAPGGSPNSVPSGASSSPVPLPAECEQAGMRLDGFEDVIVLGRDQHTWKALEKRGQGAGPFLVVGTDGDDEIVGSGGADCIVGGGGADKLTGGAGNDVLIGGAGDDRLDGGLGDDWLFGGTGVDDLLGGGGIDRFDGGPDAATCDAGSDAASVSGCQAPAPQVSPTSVSPTSAAPAPAIGGAKDQPAGQVTPAPATDSPPADASTAPPDTSTTSADPPGQGTENSPDPGGTDQASADTHANDDTPSAGS